MIIRVVFRILMSVFPIVKAAVVEYCGLRISFPLSKSVEI